MEPFPIFVILRKRNLRFAKVPDEEPALSRMAKGSMHFASVIKAVNKSIDPSSHLRARASEGQGKEGPSKRTQPVPDYLIPAAS